MDIKISDLLKIITGSDRIRIIKDKTIEHQCYAGLVPDEYQDKPVKKLQFKPIVTHKDWKERRLLPPPTPEEMLKYKFSDLELRLYYDIHI